MRQSQTRSVVLLIPSPVHDPYMTTQSDGELSEDDKSDSETEVAMDTAEHVPQQLT